MGQVAISLVRDTAFGRGPHVLEGHHGKANLGITADSKTWLGFLAREKNLAWALVTLRIRLSGSPNWLIKFGKCVRS